MAQNISIKKKFCFSFISLFLFLGVSSVYAECKVDTVYYDLGGNGVATVDRSNPITLTIIKDDWDTTDDDVTTCDVSTITSMDSMFKDETSFNQDISSWDVSNVTFMGDMFRNASAFDQNISLWDVRSVKYMWRMFHEASVFDNGGAALTWTTSSLQYSDYMFAGTSSVPNIFNQYIGAWDMTKVLKTTSMFEYNSAFDQDIGSWGMGLVTHSNMMFSEATVFNQDIHSWDMSSVISIENMFNGASSFNNGGAALTWTTSSVLNMNQAFTNASAFNQNLGVWDVSNANNLSRMLTGTALSTSNYDLLLVAWDALSLTPPSWAGSSFDTSAQYTGCSAAQTARANIMTSSGWTINDGGATTCPSLTMTITAAEVSDGDTSNDSTLAMTFTSSEATADFDVTDINTSGTGTLSPLVSTSSTVYTATFTPSAQGATTIDVAAGAFTDSFSNNNTAATQFNWTYDTTSPTTTFSPANGSTSVAVASDITLTFNDAVRLINNSALDDSNVDALITLKENNASGADIAFDATINAAKTIITIDPTINLSSTQVVYVAIGATVEDASNNAISAANTSFTSADVSAPTMTITAAEVSDGDTSNDSTLAMTFTSSEATADFDVTDINTSGTGTLSPLVSTSSTVYTATFTPSAQGATTIDVAAGAFTDSFSNNNTAATQFNWTYDTTSPTTTFSPANGSTSVAVASDITLTFNDAVRLINNSALDDSNVDALITLKENNASGADIAFDATINAAKTIITIDPTINLSSTQVVYVAIGATVEDASNNAISAANTSFTSADVSAPTMTITAAEVSDGDTSNDSTLAMTFTSSEATADFDVTDINTSGTGTLSPLVSTSSTVYTATFTPSAQGATTIDVAAGAFTDSFSNNNTAATQFNWTYDTTSPTLSSSNPADGKTGIAINTNIVLTFSEAVDVESGNIVIKKTSDNSTVETIAVTSSFVTGTGTNVITINPSITLEGLTGYYLTIAATAFANHSGNSYAGINDSTTLNFATIRTSLPTPLNKPDVTGSIETSNDIAAEWADMSIQLSYNRIAWLQRNQGSIRTSHQGIKLRFHNEMIDILMNSSPNAQIFDEIFFANKAKDAIQNANGSMLAVGDHIKSDVTAIAINEGVKLRERTIGSLNPAFEPIFGDWSVWTKGEIILGKTKATATASKQDSLSKILSLGFDRPLNNDGVIGFVFDVGRDNTKVGTSKTSVKSDNYSLSNYTAFKLDSNTSLESVVGIGRLNFDMTRVDGAETLLGDRRADQMFFSTTLKREYKEDQLIIAPYLKNSATRTNLDAFSEIGGETALSFNDQVVRDSEIGLGVDINSEIILNNNDRLRPFTKIEYNKSTSKTSASMYYSSEGPDNAYATTMNNDNNNWKLRFGADLVTESGWRSSASYTRKQTVGSGSESKYSNSFTLRSDLRF